MKRTLRLGVNIDHVATVRNARGGVHPCPIRAAQCAAEAGAEGITAHLREDRRHIKDADIARLKQEVPLPLNFEMAMTEEMLGIALQVKPHAVCLVPEKREELTTEGGLHVVKYEQQLRDYVEKLKGAGIRVSLFIDPSKDQVEASARVGATCIELHTGEYAHAFPHHHQPVLAQIKENAAYAHSLGLEVHAGHGLTYDNVGAIAAIAEIKELNIGHFLIGEALFVGLHDAIQIMRARMDEAL